MDKRGGKRPNTGGARKGAGRKPKAQEEKVVALAKEAIRLAYGSEIKGFSALLRSGEPALIKFVFEHAYGKPKEKVELTGEGGGPVQNTLKLTIVRSKPTSE